MTSYKLICDADLTGFHVNRLRLTQLTFTVGGRYRRVLAGTITQGDVKQADTTSTTCNADNVVVRLADVQNTSECFVEVQRSRQFMAVTAQSLHHRGVSTSERLWHRY